VRTFLLHHPSHTPFLTLRSNRGLDHPNILSMVGFCLHPVCLVTEFIANGNLYQYIHRLDEPTTADPDAPPIPGNSLINHNIVSLANSLKLSTSAHSVAEFAGITWPLRLKIAKDIAKGMAFLHGLTPPVIHSDLKSPNILVC